MLFPHLRKYFTWTYWSEILTGLWQSMHTTRFWREFVFMTAGMLIGAAAIYYFLLPSNIVMGSVSGFCMIINALIGGNADTLSYLMIGCNALLLILAFMLIEGEFGAKTVYTSLILGPFIQLWDKIYPYTNLTHKVIDNPEILSRVLSGETVLDIHGNPYIVNHAGELMEKVRDTVMSAGLGLGDVWFDMMCFVFLLSVCQAFEFHINASTGGLDILAKIINKYWHFDMGTSVFIGGAVICSMAFAINDFRMVVIGLMGTWINGLVIDYFMATFNRRKRVCVISDDYEQIRKYIIYTLLRGCSLYPLKGGYSGEDKVEVQALLTQEEFSSLLNFMRENNIHGFTTAGNCSEVYGLWMRHKKTHGKLEAYNE